jgi:hypothetical protein
MNDQVYKVDKQEVMMHNHTLALEKLSKIESNCSLSPIAFVKQNYSNIKIRERKTEPNLSILLAVCWSKISALAGIKSEIDSLTIEDITKMIFYSYSDLTIEEVYKAFELERYGVYEEKSEHFQQFNADYISTILKKYRHWKKQTMITQNISKNNSDNRELTPDEKEKMVADGVNRIYLAFKNTTKIEEQVEYIFDFLVDKRKIIINNNPKVKEFFESKLQEAKEQLHVEFEKKSSVSSTERKQIKYDLENIILGKSSKIIIRAKENILKEYFTKQIELGTEKIF